MGVCVIAEAGVNHNGSLDMALRLVDAAADAGADAVKFQKRTVHVVYTQAELEAPRESPFGRTNGDLKRGLEFGRVQYDRINEWADYQAIDWFASPWDLDSVTFLSQYDPPCWKVASACLTDLDLIDYGRKLT